MLDSPEALIAAPSDASRTGKLRGFLLYGLAPFAVYLAVALMQQHLAHAIEMGFGEYPDEPSHYVSGLMLHDYLLSGMKQTPLAYASDYYLHIPMMGIGHWPPGFYVLQAAWMFIAGVSRGSILILIAIVTALAAFSVYRVTLMELGWMGAFLTGGMLLAVPIIRWSNNLVMSDTLVAVLILWAALAFGLFLDSGRLSAAVWFGLLASIALLTKPAAGCLAFVPPLTILLTRRFDLLRTAALWISAAIVVVLCGPWYAAMGRLNFYGSSEAPFAQTARSAMRMFLNGGRHELGFLAMFSIAGVYACIRRRPGLTGQTAALISLPAAVLGMSVLSGVDMETRFLIPAIIPMLALAGYSAAWIASLLPAVRMQRPAKIAALCGVWAIVYAAGSQAPATLLSPDDGLREMLARMEPDNGDAGAAVLIAGSSASGDGRIIAGFAELMSKRPRQMLIRAEKLIANSNWNGTQYSVSSGSPDQIIEELNQDGVSLIALDTSSRWGYRWPHSGVLLAALEKNPDLARLIYSSKQPAYLLYQFRSEHPPQVPGALLRNLKEKVGRLPF